MDRFRATRRSRRRALAPLLLAGGLLLAVRPALAEGEPAGVTVRTLVQSTKSWNGTPLPAYPSGQPVINAGMLIRGRLLVTSATGASVQLQAGQGLIEMVNQPHYGTNNGTEPAEIVVVYAGVKGQPITVPAPALR